MSIVDEILNEAKDESWQECKGKILTSMKKFYEHALKYKHNPANQSMSWVISMRNAKDEINETLTHTKVKTMKNNISEDEFKEAYEAGMNKTAAKNPECKGKYDIYKEFPTFVEIADSSKVENFIRNYAKHPYVVDKLFKEWVDFDAYLESLTESDRETILMLENAIDYVSKEELVNFLKSDAPEIYKEAVIEYINENTKEE